MLLLTSTSDLVQVVTSAAGQIEVHASFADVTGTPQVVTPGRTNTADITTAATTTVVGSPAASTQRNVKHLNIYNASTSVSNVIDVVHTDGTTAQGLMHATLLPRESLVFDAEGRWAHYDANGIPKTASALVLFNSSVAAQGPGFATDTYLNNSFIKFIKPPKIGTKYKCRFSVSKTAAGTATPIIQVRVGVNGTTGDTSRNSFTFSAGTAATDTGVFEIIIVFRSVGGGTSAVAQGYCALTSQPTTGISSLIKAVQTTSGGFDSTVADLGVGISVNGGTSAAWTVQQVIAEIENND